MHECDVLRWGWGPVEVESIDASHSGVPDAIRPAVNHNKRTIAECGAHRRRSRIVPDVKQPNRNRSEVRSKSRGGASINHVGRFDSDHNPTIRSIRVGEGPENAAKANYSVILGQITCNSRANHV